MPYLDLSWPYHNDRNVTGGLLRCGGRLYLKGLGVHSAARLSYALDGRYRRFQAELGIDDSTGGRGSVEFRVLVDGRQRYASGPIRGGARAGAGLDRPVRRQAARLGRRLRRARRRAGPRRLAGREAGEVRGKGQRTT